MIDRTGKRYGRWTALRCLGYRRGALFWLCQCDCGRKRAINVSNLAGYTTQCVECCREQAKQEAKKRREYRLKNWPKSYWIWLRIRMKAVRRWRSYDLFMEDMGHPPNGGRLRRYDARKKYGSSNCYWERPLTDLPAGVLSRLGRKRTRNAAIVEAVAVHHITQADLHRHLGVSRERISQIVRKPR